MRTIANRLIRGLWKGVKWTVIQYLAILVFGFLLYYGIILSAKVFSIDERALFMSWPHSAYTFWTGFLGVFFIPTSSFLFGVWHELFPHRRLWWTALVPWLLLMGFVYLYIAYVRDWNFNIIRIDNYMLGGWTCPLFGAGIQGIIRFIFGPGVLNVRMVEMETNVRDKVILWLILFPAFLLFCLIAAAWIFSRWAPPLDRALATISACVALVIITVMFVMKAKGLTWQPVALVLSVFLLLPTLGDLLLYLWGDVRDGGLIAISFPEGVRFFLLTLLLLSTLGYYRDCSKAMMSNNQES